MRVLRISALGGVFLGVVAVTPAAIAYNSFGAGFSFGGGSWQIGKLDAFPNALIAQAFQFTAGASGNVTSIRVAVQELTAQSANPSTPAFDLFTDNAGAVGTYISTWNGTLVGAPAVQTLTGGSASLTAGTKYWLKARDPAGTEVFGWNVNSLGWTTSRARSGNNGATWAYDTNSQAAFRIDVSASSVPEPFTMALMGGAALAGFRRMRRSRV